MVPSSASVLDFFRNILHKVFGNVFFSIPKNDSQLLVASDAHSAIA